MSMGVATFPDNSDDVHEIVKMADMAMYDAKRSGKNRYNFYDGSKNHNTVQRLDIENNMRQAVASQIHEFVVFYQPVVDTVTKNVCHVRHLYDGTVKHSDLWDQGILYRLLNTSDL